MLHRHNVLTSHTNGPQLRLAFDDDTIGSQLTSDDPGDPAAGCGAMTLREQVEAILPNWQSWYPSLFHAAEDLGVIRARVCSPSSLLLSNRHAGVTTAALKAHREQWGGSDD